MEPIDDLGTDALHCLDAGASVLHISAHLYCNVFAFVEQAPSVLALGSRLLLLALHQLIQQHFYLH